MEAEIHIQIKQLTNNFFNFKTMFLITKFDEEICKGNYNFEKQISIKFDSLINDIEDYNEWLSWNWFLEKNFPKILKLGSSSYPINFEMFDVNYTSSKLNKNMYQQQLPYAFIDNFLIINDTFQPFHSQTINIEQLYNNKDHNDNNEQKIIIRGKIFFHNIMLKKNELLLKLYLLFV